MTVVHQAREQQSAAPGLRALRELFERMHNAGVRYCHWKSNEHLGSTMTGTTDVDILVERRDAQRLTYLLTENTVFKRFVVKPGYGYPGIEDYIGFDRDTGTLIHLHIHYQLTLGEKFIKGHRLPWEELYLSTRIMDEQYGIYVTDPHLELVVLLLRSAMKLRARDFVLEALGRRYFRDGLLQELRWLAQRVNEGRLQQVATQVVGARAAHDLPGILAESRPSIGRLRTFARRADPPLHVYRLYGRLTAARRMAMVEWDYALWRLKNLIAGAPAKSNRTIPQGGLFVAVLGADGAGKTTVITGIAEWLSREVAVLVTDGGRGKESASLSRRVLRRATAIRRARGLGWIVLSHGLAVRLMDISPPDLVIKLHVSPQVARQRKPEAPADLLRTVADVDRNLEFSPTTRVADVDADQPLTRVLLEVKCAVWDSI